MSGTCDVLLNTNACTALPSVEDGGRTRGSASRCGKTACMECTVRQGNRRICNDCLEDAK